MRTMIIALALSAPVAAQTIPAITGSTTTPPGVTVIVAESRTVAAPTQSVPALLTVARPAICDVR